ncbi:MAG: hypothetical protein QM687_00215 [Ferruginibacter sp.]
MYTVRNLQFTRLYKVDGYLKEFNFRKSNPSAEGRCSVDTVDARGNRIMFFMEKTDADWKIIPQKELPGWIVDQEPNLQEAISTELDRN